MTATKKHVAAITAVLTGMMTALATLTASLGVTAGLIALVFAVAAVGVGAPTMALLQIGRSVQRTGRPPKERSA
jgi:hypothetical protein